MRHGLIMMAVVVLVFGGIRSVEALPIGESEPNNSIGTAQNIDGSFSLDFDANIGDTTTNTSLTIPHVTIDTTGDGTFDYYSFTVPAGGTLGIFDIDFGDTAIGGLDTQVFLYTLGGTLLAENDDANSEDDGALGSDDPVDSYLEHTFASAGTFVISVGELGSTGSFGGITLGNAPDTGDAYVLQVSIVSHSVIPEPSTMLLLGTGLAGLVAWRMRKAKV
ncbi:MAG: PEP-CTERM sorting domain-containing protein [Nitrospinae bacterium]|nr:PEP-CTERM sorting domain-containing protein [Nitrospinota bacterium]